ncbi:ferredoxin reductase [Microbacterium pumilum]|uniref:Ferredoxin reductase n=1 Tax=Microbacterium pumilum TaxID=344165 RepID=A0ABN2SKT6_9MICO
MIVGDWRAARVVDVSDATATARVLRVTVPGWPGSDPGQHVDIRLTAEDGYQAVRSYSLGSYGADDTIELAVDEIPEGEVSPYLVRDVRPGDELEVKGPLGGYFVWRAGGVDPVQLIAGGSGIVPLMAMARARTDAATGAPFRLLYSVRTGGDAIYRDELGMLSESGGVAVTWAYTRAAPPGWDGRVGRLDRAGIEAAIWSTDRMPAVYVCGPTGFVEHVADTLVELGHDARRIKTERFGGA